MTYEEFSKGMWAQARWYHLPAVWFFKICGIDDLLEATWNAAKIDKMYEDIGDSIGG